MLQRALREEVEGRLEEALRQTQQAKKMATVNWWRALKMKEDRTKAQKQASMASHAREETEEKQRLAEATIQELQDQVRHLQAALRTASLQCGSSGERRDVAVSTDPLEEGPGGGRDSEAERAMEAWRRVEAMARKAANAADSLQRCEGRLHQARERVEAAAERVEQALSRAADAEAQLNQLKGKISEKLEVQAPAL